MSLWVLKITENSRRLLYDALSALITSGTFDVVIVSELVDVSVWSIVWIEKPATTINAIAAATPAVIPSFLLFEKLDVELPAETDLLGASLRVSWGSYSSSGWFLKCVEINDSTYFLSSIVIKLSCFTVSLIFLVFLHHHDQILSSHQVQL